MLSFDMTKHNKPKPTPVPYIKDQSLVKLINTSETAAQRVPYVRNGVAHWTVENRKLAAPKTKVSITDDSLYRLNAKSETVCAVFEVQDVTFERGPKGAKSVVNTKGYFLLTADSHLIYIQHNWLEKPGTSLKLEVVQDGV